MCLLEGFGVLDVFVSGWVLMLFVVLGVVIIGFGRLIVGSGVYWICSVCSVVRCWSLTMCGACVDPGNLIFFIAD